MNNGRKKRMKSSSNFRIEEGKNLEMDLWAEEVKLEYY